MLTDKHEPLSEKDRLAPYSPTTKNKSQESSLNQMQKIVKFSFQYQVPSYITNEESELYLYEPSPSYFDFYIKIIIFCSWR